MAWDNKTMKLIKKTHTVPTVRISQKDRKKKEKERPVMGEIKKKESTADKITARETKRQENVHRDNETIEKLSSRSNARDKMISARFNSTAYAKFQKICDIRGMTVNGCLNMLVMDYIIQNRDLLDD